MFDYKCVGLDVFVYSTAGLPKLPEHFGDFRLEMISERGLKVWPGPLPEGLVSHWYRCRYRGEGITDSSIMKLLLEIEKVAVWEKLQKLWNHNGQDLFSKAYES